MTIIARNMRLVGSKGEEEVEGLFDSGATYSCIEKSLAEKLGVIDVLPEPMRFETKTHHRHYHDAEVEVQVGLRA